MIPLWLAIPLLILLLAASAFFSGSETALFSLQRETLTAFKKSPRRAARRVVELLSTPRELLATILFGNLVVNVLFYAMTAVMAVDLAQRGHKGLAAAVGAGSLFAVIVFGEVTPKAASLSYRKTLSQLFSGPLLAVYYVFAPVRAVVGALVRALTAAALRVVGHPQRITREELSMLVEVTRSQGHIPPHEGEMIEEVMGLSETRVREVMTPRVDIVAIEEDARLEDLVAIFRRTSRTRLPVFRGDIDHIVGIAQVKRALLEPVSSLADVTDEPVFVPATKTAENLLNEFQGTRAKMAIVVDEYGGTAGVVTLADLVEEIVGPIGDEFEGPQKLVEEIPGGGWLLAGDLSIKEWNELFEVDLESERISTLGGFIVYLLGHVPRKGDTVQYRNVHFTVEEVRRHRIVYVRAELREGESGEGAQR